MDVEKFRQYLLDEICAGAFSGLGAMILDADEVRRASPEQLVEIAQRYGMIQ
jgi:hypothetical protein